MSVPAYLEEILTDLLVSNKPIVLNGPHPMPEWQTGRFTDRFGPMTINKTTRLDFVSYDHLEIIYHVHTFG